MQETPNLGLKMPEDNEWADIEYLNENARIIDGLFSLDLIEEAFRSVFSDFQDDPEPTTFAAMTSEDILRAIRTEWNGESSEHPNAMRAEDIEQALNTEWNGESSTNPNAMSAEDINNAIANATI